MDHLGAFYCKCCVRNNQWYNKKMHVHLINFQQDKREPLYKIAFYCFNVSHSQLNQSLVQERNPSPGVRNLPWWGYVGFLEAGFYFYHSNGSSWRDDGACSHYKLSRRAFFDCEKCIPSWAPPLNPHITLHHTYNTTTKPQRLQSI